MDTGGIIEEVREFIFSRFQGDEWQESMLKLQLEQTRILQHQFGAVGSELPLVGENQNVPIDRAADFRFVPITPESIEEVETEDDVLIGAGSTDTVLEHQPLESALWYSVGTTDEDNSEYQYLVDDVELFGDPVQVPQAPYPDTALWPQPIIVRDSLEVRVTRTNSASGAANYVSKMRLVPISNVTAQQLETAWGQL